MINTLCKNPSFLIIVKSKKSFSNEEKLRDTIFICRIQKKPQFCKNWCKQWALILNKLKNCLLYLCIQIIHFLFVVKKKFNTIQILNIFKKYSKYFKSILIYLFEYFYSIFYKIIDFFCDVIRLCDTIVLTFSTKTIGFSSDS